MQVSIRCIAAAAALSLVAPSFAQFAPAGSTISGTVTGQTLPANTGTINAVGAISITTNGVALSMTGTSTLINNGTIQTTGTGRAIDSNSGTANLTVTNIGLISSVSSDAFRVNTDSTVSLTNSGTIQVTAGGQAIDWAAITTKSNILNNLVGGVITAVGDDAVRPGTNGIVNNAGIISATPTGGASPSGSDGIDVRTFSGIQITNSGLISGRHGIATDGNNVGPSSITVTNNTGGVIQALNGSGINIDGVSATVTATVVNQLGATIKGGVLAAATAGDGDGIDVDGVLTLTNHGDILGMGAKGAGNNAEGIAAGGGTITNTATGRIIGSTTLADAPNGDPSKAGNGILIDDSDGGNAIAKTTVTNSGLIQGVSGFAIKLIGTFANVIENLAGGIIKGAGTILGSGAAVQTGNGDDNIVNAGKIIGTNGLAIDMQGGKNTLIIQGGEASIVGDINGGAGGTQNLLRFAVGPGNKFEYSGAISNFNTVEVLSGRVKLDGSGSNFGSSNLVLSGGELELAAPGDTFFRSLSLLGDSVLDLDLVSSLTFDELGNLADGKTLTVLDFPRDDSAQNYAFRFLGDLTGDAKFLALIGLTTINGAGAGYFFDGRYTQVQVPEPSTVAMLGLGLALLTAMRRRSRTAQPA
jgi:hypothetical protein